MMEMVWTIPLTGLWNRGLQQRPLPRLCLRGAEARRQSVLRHLDRVPKSRSPRCREGASSLRRYKAKRVSADCLGLGLVQLLSPVDVTVSLIHSITTVALLMAIATIGFTPASALITTPDRKLYVGSSVTPVHCQKKYHCHWRGEGANRNKHCHICGYQLANLSCGGCRHEPLEPGEDASRGP